MKIATTALLLMLHLPLCSSAEDEQNTPKLDDSLKELRWLVGEWTPKERRLWEKHQQYCVLNSPVRITVEKDGKAIKVSYIIGYEFGFGATGSSLDVFTQVEEIITYDSESRSYVVAYRFFGMKNPPVIGGDTGYMGPEGRGRYSLRKDGDSWVGEPQAKYHYPGIKAPPSHALSGEKSASCNMRITRTAEKTIQIVLFDRKGCPLGLSQLEIVLSRSDPKEKTRPQKK